MSQPAPHPRIRTVFLDRDGVLNRKAPEGEYVHDWSQVEILPGVPEAISLLGTAEVASFVVTNQRGASLGLYTTGDIECLHARMRQEITREGGAIEAFFYCPHGKDCVDCRKPNSGMFERARALHPEITWETSAMIGDSHSDIEAGKRLGMYTIFIDGEPGRQKPGAEKARAEADAVVGSLLEAVHLLLA